MTLLIALILLVAMTAAGIVLLRSVDLSNIIAGNLTSGVLISGNLPVSLRPASPSLGNRLTAVLAGVRRVQNRLAGQSGPAGLLRQGIGEDFALALARAVEKVSHNDPQKNRVASLRRRSAFDGCR